MIDYEALAVRSFDQVPSRAEWAALRVWADTLEVAGDPRGTLIAIEHTLRAQPARRRELLRAAHDHALAHAATLLGPLEALMLYRRALELDWRSGRLYGAFLDTRYLAGHVGRGPVSLVTQLVEAPAAVALRRLHVRVRNGADAERVMEALAAAPTRPLEEIAVLIGDRPRRLAPAGMVASRARVVSGRYPGLRLFAQGHWLHRLPVDDNQPAMLEIGRAAAAALPETAEGRAALGRALLRSEPELRAIALARLAELGERGGALVETLMTLLAPRFVTPQAPIVACLGRLGELARSARPLLAAITGRVEQYDLETRRAAGEAIAALRA